MKWCLALSTLALGIVTISCDNQQKSSSPTDSTPKQSVEVMSEVAPSENDIPMLIGTYTRKEGHVDGKASGVHVAYLNPTNGQMRLGGTYDAGINPSYLAIHPSKKYAYVVNEIGGKDHEPWGSVTALQFNEDHTISTLNNKSSKGVAPCHISLNQQGTSLLVASYVTGDITSFSTTMTGELAGAQTVHGYSGTGPHDRQRSSHAHYISQLADGDIVTTDLGSDTIRFHDFERGQLSKKKAYVTTTSGAGPRHLVAHPSHPIIYVINELNATIESFRKNANSQYQRYQTITTLPEGDRGEGHCAAIKVTSDGRYLYASNRGDYNNIAIYKINEDGKLEMVSHQSTLGNVPRDIEISPDDQYLIAANQNSDNLVSFKIDQSTGLLQAPKILEGIATPACIKFL